MFNTYGLLVDKHKIKYHQKPHESVTQNSKSNLEDGNSEWLDANRATENIKIQYSRAWFVLCAWDTLHDDRFRLGFLDRNVVLSL